MTTNNQNSLDLDFRLHFDKLSASHGNDKIKLKVCGMKHNTLEVASLQPDYLGFIFYDKSPRNFTGSIPVLPKDIKKVGVFVNATIDTVIENINTFQLDVVQLHGDESPEYCKRLKLYCHSALDVNDIEIIKVFSIKDEFDFSVLKPYETVCDYYLFDTKGKAKGGNGYTFDWSVLKDYPSNKPYFLSGGIGVDEIEQLKAFFTKEESQHCIALDINSKFEIEPGLKNIEELHQFKQDVIMRRKTTK